MHALRKLAAQSFVFFGGNAPGPPVGEDPFFVNSGEVYAHEKVLGRHGEIHASGGQEPPSHVCFHRIVTEKREMGGAASRSNPVSDRIKETAEQWRIPLPPQN